MSWWATISGDAIIVSSGVSSGKAELISSNGHRTLLLLAKNTHKNLGIQCLQFNHLPICSYFTNRHPSELEIQCVL